MAPARALTPDDHRALRTRLGLTAGAEARLLGVDPRTVRRWDLGERDVPPPVRRLLMLLDRERESGPVAVAATLAAMAD